jgi:hypothetical protein
MKNDIRREKEEKSRKRQLNSIKQKRQGEPAAKRK